MTRRWYTWNHEWYEIVDGDDAGSGGDGLRVRCGLAPAFFAGASELVGIELPAVGDVVKADDAVGMIEFSKAVFELRTLFDGVIVWVGADVNALVGDGCGDLAMLSDALFELRCDERDFQRRIADAVLIDAATYASQTAADTGGRSGVTCF